MRHFFREPLSSRPKSNPPETIRCDSSKFSRRLRICNPTGVHRAYRCHAFTLIELLVVIAIIGLLAAISIPAAILVVESARKTQCTVNLKQMGTAMIAYQVTHRYYPATWVNGDTSWTWAKVILPYTEHADLLDDWDVAADFNKGRNRAICATGIPLFRCPSSPSGDRYVFESGEFAGVYGTNDYKGCQSVNASDPLLASWGLKSWIPGIVSRWPVRDNEISDGTSKTLLLVESTGGLTIYGPNFKPYPRIPNIWYATDGAWMGRALSGLSPTNFGLTFNIPLCGVNCTNMYDYGPFSFHRSGANVLLADGTAKYLSTDTDARILCSLYAYADGQIFSVP